MTALILVSSMAVSALAYALGYAAGKLHRKSHELRYWPECKMITTPDKIDWTGSVGRSRGDCDERWVPGGGSNI